MNVPIECWKLGLHNFLVCILSRASNLTSEREELTSHEVFEHWNAEQVSEKVILTVMLIALVRRGFVSTVAVGGTESTNHA